MAHDRDRAKSQVMRVSVSLPPKHHEALTKIALQKKVSLAWVVRDAVERYLASDSPLFSNGVARRL